MSRYLRASAAIIFTLSCLILGEDAVIVFKPRAGICTAIHKKVTRQIIPTNETINVRSVKIGPNFPFIHAEYRKVPVNRTLVTVTKKRVYICCEGWKRLGNQCQPICSYGCVHGTCVQPSQCLCQPGYTGSRCTVKCSPGYYGRNCANRCNCENSASCDPVSGKCKCTPGHLGSRCDKTCPSGRWGPFCLFKCKCQNGASCDPATGHCTCLPGYRGSTCRRHCKRSTYGVNCANKCQCQNNSPCDHRNGKCLCRSGYTGEDCGEKCPPGTFGSKCMFNCNCKNGGICNVRNGRCLCPPGWIGPKCADSCPNGSYGISCLSTCHCNATEICHRERGCTTVHVISLLPHDKPSSNTWKPSRKNLFSSFTVTLSVMLFFMFFVIGILIGTMAKVKKTFARKRLDESVSTISTDEKCVNLDGRDKIDYPKDNQLHTEMVGQNNPCYKG